VYEYEMELKIHIFTNPLNEKEWVMVPEEKIVEGYLFADYVSTGSRVLTPDNTGAMKWSKENGITEVVNTPLSLHSDLTYKYNQT
jgi:hypothetical protein